VKGKGKVVPLRSIEAHLGYRRYSSYSFLTSALEGGEWSASRPGRALPPGKEPPVPIVEEAGWAPQPVWTQRLEEKILCLCRRSNPGRRVRSRTQYWLSYPGSRIYNVGLLFTNLIEMLFETECVCGKKKNYLKPVTYEFPTCLRSLVSVTSKSSSSLELLLSVTWTAAILQTIHRYEG
jgi:hypothetical protein